MRLLNVQELPSLDSSLGAPFFLFLFFASLPSVHSLAPGQPAQSEPGSHVAAVWLVPLKAVCLV